MEELLAGRRVYIRTLGSSMEPLLHENHSTAVIEPLSAPLKRGDVALYHKKGTCVLHRVHRLRKDAYVFRGDNCVHSELVKKDQVLGVMCGYFTGERFRPCRGAAYAFYQIRLPLRLAYLKGRFYLGQVSRKMGLR